MSWRSKFWPAAVVLFLAVNAGGAVFAASQGEWEHAGIHAGLLVLGACIAWSFAPRRDATTIGQATRDTRALLERIDHRVTELEQSVAAIAVEVERIGEGQRFMTRLLVERDRVA